MDRRERLPSWRSVLAVVAHPDDESFGLGAVLSAFVEQGARVGVLSFTRGEASTLQGVDGDLATVRAAELASAAAALGVDTVRLAHYPDGRLRETPAEELVDEVVDLADRTGAEGLVVFDSAGVTGHPDHRQATAAALAAADRLGLPVLAWTLPAAVADVLNRDFSRSSATFIGHRDSEIDLVATVDRRRQYEAVRRHPSQAVPTSALWRRLELLGPYEHLRWLRRGAEGRERVEAVEHGSGDQVV